MRGSDADTGNAVNGFGGEEDKRARDKSRKDGQNSRCLASGCSDSPTVKESKKAVPPRTKAHKRKKRHNKGKAESATAVNEEEEEALLKVLDDILQ